MGGILRIHPIRVFDISSQSSPGKSYRVQFDGSRWYCDCPAWIYNIEHKGETDEEGKAVPRECKHTRLALKQIQRGEVTYRVIRPLGPWFDELQDYVARLVDFSRNGEMTTHTFAGFHADLKRFRTEREKVADSLSTVDTMIDLYQKLLGQISKGF